MNVVLCGFKCCGKTTCGAAAAATLNRTFVDTDAIVESLYFDPAQGRQQRLNCREIYQTHGEEFFRSLEREAVRKARAVKRGIIATGGGSVLDFVNYIELKRLGILVYLQSDRGTIQERIRTLSHPPAYFDPKDPEGSFDRLYDARVQTYEHVADRILDTQGLSAQQVAEAICALYWEIGNR